MKAWLQLPHAHPHRRDHRLGDPRPAEDSRHRDAAWRGVVPALAESFEVSTVEDD